MPVLSFVIARRMRQAGGAFDQTVAFHPLCCIAATLGPAVVSQPRREFGLPGLIDGWEVAAAYRERHPQRPVIYASTSARVERRTVPGSIYVRKPFQVREILALARMMAGSNLTEEGLRAAG